MFRRHIQLLVGGVTLACLLHSIVAAEDCPLDMKRPACGKVCKLVCETKKLTSIGYGNECKSICLPDPSRPGCKHCAVCCGECKCDPCTCCQSTAPKCEFCWRDWFACGCACPRTVKVLTKYQAEKKICWYHWEVVDRSCCDCVGKDGDPVVGSDGFAQSTASHSIYKPAPENAEMGAVIPVTDDEWVKLAAVLTPDPKETSEQVAVGPASKVVQPDAESESPKPSVAERVERLFRK